MCEDATRHDIQILPVDDRPQESTADLIDVSETLDTAVMAGMGDDATASITYTCASSVCRCRISSTSRCLIVREVVTCSRA